MRHNPPFAIVGVGSEPGGLAYEVMNEAARRSGIRLEWRTTSLLNRELLGRSEADLWPIADPSEGGGVFETTRPWLQDVFYIMSLAGPADPPRRIALNRIPRNLELARRSLPGVELVEVDGGQAALQEVCFGRVQAAFINARMAEQLILSRPPGCTDAALERRVARGAEMPLGIAFLPHAREAAARMRDAIDQMARDGGFAAILSRWALLANSDVERQVLLLAEQQRQRALWTGIAALLLIALCAAALAAASHRALRLARQASNTKSRFLAIASHELRTPLNGFLGLTDLLLQSPLNPEQREIATAIAASSRSFRQIVDDILDYSRAEAQRLDLSPAPADPVAIIADAVRTLTPKAAAKQLILEAPPPRDPLPIVDVDAGRLRQVLLNLIDNAIKFTESGRVTVRVRRRPNPDSPALADLTFEVSDTGIGMPASRLALMFEPFNQGEATSRDQRRYGGLGLGLSISKALVQRMGGHLGLSSKVGVGTVALIDLSLPLSSAPLPPPRVPALPAETAGAPVAHHPLLVLVVDDSRTNREVAVRLLKKLGHQAAVAGNGLEAVETVRAARASLDLVLMDCQMPEMDGFEATALIRSSESPGEHLPIVALTAGVAGEDQQRCLAAGMDAFLSKPVSLAELEAALRAHARQRADPPV